MGIKRTDTKGKVGISSKGQITRALMIFVIPFIIFLLSYNMYTIKALNEKLAETGQNLLYIYKGPIETEIYGLQQSVVDIMANDSDFQQMIYAKKKYERYAWMQKVSTKFQRIFTTNTAAAGCIIYEAENDMIQEVYVESSYYSYTDKKEFKEILRKYVQDDELLRDGWRIWEVNGHHYLFRVYCKRDIYIMGMYDLNRIQKPQNYADNKQDSFLFFTDIQMNPLTSIEEVEACKLSLTERKEGEYYFSGNPGKYLIVQENMGALPFRIVYAAPYYGIFMSSNRVPFFFLIISMVLVILLWLSYRMLEERYLKPFQKLVETMGAVKNGNMEAKMNDENVIREFHILSKAFNEMLDEIKTLKISSYEYQLEMQQAKLQYLQIQIRPHFFLNCLKNLYALAEEGKADQIQKTILVLSEHLRYMMRDNFSLIPIETEIQSVENYILLQQLTSYYSVSCHIDLEERLKKYEIPPLSILAFVENSIKHANLTERKLKIQIRINSWCGEGEEFVSITILDNGIGFSDESLKELNGRDEFAYDGRHVGIQNVKHRFSLIYKEKVTFLFSNMTGSGACIQILIPLTEKTEG